MKRSAPDDDSSSTKQQQQQQRLLTAASSTGCPAVRLLLHAVDGVIPYLTPHLLETCFPRPTTTTTHDNNDLLWIGLALGDTCVVPVYGGGADDDDDDAQGDDKEKQQQQSRNTTTTKKKPRGYTFSSCCPVDEWLSRHYQQRLVTVPSFDLLDDAARPRGGKRKQQQKDDTKSITSSSSSSSISSLGVTNQHVLLWTSNGRVPLTPELCYNAMMKGLDSPMNVPLFDMIVPEPRRSDMARRMKNNPYIKRKQAAIRRTQQWTEDFRSRLKRDDDDDDGSFTKKKIWTPILVDTQGHVMVEEGRGGDDSINKLLSSADKAGNSDIAGVALIGWQHVEDANARRAALTSVARKLELGAVKNNQHQTSDGQHQTSSSRSDEQRPILAVLSTRSLAQILEAAQSGCNMIGTSLPTLWARSKKAFVCDLKKITTTCWHDNDGDGDDQKCTTTEPSKRARTDDEEKNQEHLASLLDENGCIDLSTTLDKKDHTSHPWFRDGDPILSDCSCLVCKTHSRAYIYHLVCAKELLAEILLFIHNLHHMLQLLREINNNDNKRGLQPSKETGKSDLRSYKARSS